MSIIKTFISNQKYPYLCFSQSHVTHAIAIMFNLPVYLAEFYVSIVQAKLMHLP